MNEQTINLLPTTLDSEMKKPKWSYLYAYNLGTLRDIFVYCVHKSKIDKEALYGDIVRKISPPRKHWINKKGKTKQDKERLILEYEHAARYLGLIKRTGDIITPSFDTFGKEKKIIMKENQYKDVENSYSSSSLSDKEQKAFLRIVLNYERARDFLWWFLDFPKFSGSGEFQVQHFRKYGKPIYISSEMVPGKKGSEQLRRDVDRKIWTIPDKYIRLANFVFPKWFRELGVIDKITILPEFSNDRKIWHMFYPIKMSTKEFLEYDLANFLESTFLKKDEERTLWIPYLVYFLSRKFLCPFRAVKISIENLYKQDFEHFYLERTSLQVMKERLKYKENYIKVDGFYRSTLRIARRGGKNGQK